MATYVTSDAHGHIRALDEALGAASLGSDDTLYVLGDMIDRGPDPLGVVSVVRSLPQARVLMGNHEQLMLRALACVGKPVDGAFVLSGLDRGAFGTWMDWMGNGGATTSAQLEQLTQDEFTEFVVWVRSLANYACVAAGGRTFALAHAGIRPQAASEWLAQHPGADLASTADVEALLASQEADDLLWIREGFWDEPTGLVDEAGRGCVVVSGHTPSPYLAMLLGLQPGSCTDERGLGTMVELGSCEGTGHVADKIDIDCAAAMGAGAGRVGILRLDDGERWFADIREGE